MLKEIKYELVRHPIGTMFLIIGYTISLLMISIGITNIVKMQEIALARTEGTPQNALVINGQFDSEIDFNQFLSIFNGINKESNIIFSEITTYIDESKKNELFEINCELFNKIQDWRYPILEGSYYDTEDIKYSNKVILIGKQLNKYTFREHEEKYIKVAGEKYKVLGIIGDKKKSTPWDYQLFMPITSIPKSIKNELIDLKNVSCTIYNSHISTLNDCEIIKKNILKMDDKATITINELENKQEMIANTFGSNDTLIITAFLIFIISIINSTNMTSFWIDERKLEIGIKKAFGFNNYNISFMIFKEIISIIFIASIVSLIIQFGMSVFLTDVFKFSLDISIQNFIVALVCTFISALVSSSIPIYKALKIKPIEALKL